MAENMHAWTAAVGRGLVLGLCALVLKPHLLVAVSWICSGLLFISAQVQASMLPGLLDATAPRAGGHGLGGRQLWCHSSHTVGCLCERGGRG